MTTQTQTLASFILARVAEDEATASNWSRFEVRDGIPGNYAIPARVLAECEAKRRIVALRVADPYDCGKAHPTMDIYHPDGHADQDPILRHLAAVYADHEDYRQEWRP